MPSGLVFVDRPKGFHRFRHGELLSHKPSHKPASSDLAPGFQTSIGPNQFSPTGGHGFPGQKFWEHHSIPQQELVSLGFGGLRFRVHRFQSGPSAEAAPTVGPGAFSS